MKPANAKSLRCAIYTRVSTDAGLEQDFNSLDAQREASEAFIKSQAHEGWQLIKTVYNDGGYSGGNIDRPALQKLLADIKAKLIDVVLVYKVDRLTRSLADFAKLVELFDANNVSFVAVTQAFNTTSSMGRLTLNVLLSFAQFEREVTAERIRDKIAASKKKGLWMGGGVPLGYRVQDRKLIVDPAEAKIVQMIFERYLALGSTLPLLTELYEGGIRTRIRTRASGKKFGGVPFTHGPLGSLLKNRTYLGEIVHYDKYYPGEHQPIIEKDLFERVQARMADNTRNRRANRLSSPALLMGKIFDDNENLMAPSYSMKGTNRYRYYFSRALIEGRRKAAGSIRRVSGPEVEELIVHALSANQSHGETDAEQLIQTFVKRIIVRPGEILINLTSEGTERFQRPTLSIDWTQKPKRVKRQIILPHADETKDQRPIRAERRKSLLQAIGKSRQWLRELADGTVEGPEQLATREGRSKRSVNMLLSLAFVSPEIVEAAMCGQLPRGINLTRLLNLPPLWSDQRQALGLAPAA